MAEVDVPSGALAAIRSSLADGRTAIEDTATSAPDSVDGGDATHLLMSLLSGASGAAGELSRLISAVRDEVETAEAGFWTTDEAAGEAFAGARLEGSAPIS